MKDIIIISIFGGSASGKSTLARSLEEQYPNVFSRVPADRLINNKLEDDDQYFIKPVSYDWDYFKLLLKNKRIGERVNLPLFDYDSFKRVAKISDKSFVVARYLLIDSIAPYPNSDYIFYLNTPTEIRKSRMLNRDASQNSNIFEHWKWSIISEKYYREKFHKTSITLDGTEKIETLTELVRQTVFNNLLQQGNQ